MFLFPAPCGGGDQRIFSVYQNVSGVFESTFGELSGVDGAGLWFDTECVFWGEEHEVRDFFRARYCEREFGPA